MVICNDATKVVLAEALRKLQADMDERYAAGTAYRSDLPFDVERGHSIRAATLALADCIYPTYPDYGLNMPVLDVGCGQCGIASFWPHKRIVGVEISEEAVALARKANPDVKYLCCPIERFELGAGMAPFKLVVAQESIEHWVDVDRGMVAIRAAMAKDGALIITTPNRDSLHCRMRRKLEMKEAPYCSSDHVHEFGFLELIHRVEQHGFKLEASKGVGLLPYWTMEGLIGSDIRRLTDSDTEVVAWFEAMGRSISPSFAFIQCHRFRKVGP